jgi:hypothetical protein
LTLTASLASIDQEEAVFVSAQSTSVDRAGGVSGGQEDRVQHQPEGAECLAAELGPETEELDMAFAVADVDKQRSPGDRFLTGEEATR